MTPDQQTEVIALFRTEFGPEVVSAGMGLTYDEVFALLTSTHDPGGPPLQSLRNPACYTDGTVPN